VEPTDETDRVPELTTDARMPRYTAETRLRDRLLSTSWFEWRGLRGDAAAEDAYLRRRLAAVGVRSCDYCIPVEISSPVTGGNNDFKWSPLCSGEFQLVPRCRSAGPHITATALPPVSWTQSPTAGLVRTGPPYPLVASFSTGYSSPGHLLTTPAPPRARAWFYDSLCPTALHARLNLAKRTANHRLPPPA
jgi:hypothetical protein